MADPQKVITDGLRSYGAAMKELGNADRQEVGRWLTTGLKTHINHSDDESAPWSGFDR